MSIYSYKIFLEVSESGSFVKAAEKLNLSASAISHTMKAMEDELGFQLFRRSRSGASLTENGERILPFVKDLIAAEQKITQEANRINNLEIGTVRIGMFASVGSNWFVKILQEFKQKYPGINVVISQGSYGSLLDWISEKRVDLAFLTDEVAKNAGREADFMPLHSDPLICVASGSFLPENRFSVTVNDLKNNPLYINKDCNDYDARGFLAKNQIPIDAYYDIVDHQTLFALVREGMGLCIVPELVAKSAPSSIRKFPIIGNPRRVIGLLTTDPRSVSPACERLKNAIIEYVERL